MDGVTKRWIKTPGDEHAVEKHGCYFDEEEAQDVVDFIETVCKHSQGKWAGKPFKLLDWQKNDFVMPLYGWMRANGTRRFREAYLCVGKKNGKSTLCSALEIVGVAYDGEPGAEIYSAAVVKEQAAIIHREAANMVETSRVLKEHFGLRVVNNTKTIHMGTNSWIRALAADSGGRAVQGIKTYYLVIDELHAWNDRGFYGSLRYGMRAREQPLSIVITTAGDDENSMWGEKHDYAKRVLSGEQKDFSFLPVIYQPPDGLDLDKEENFLDKKNWHAANPSLGVTLSEEDFAEDLNRALLYPMDWAEFKRYRFNVCVGTDMPWLNMPAWAECGHRVIDEQKYYGRPCYAGLDLSTSQDTTAFVMVFPETDGSYTIIPRIWVPEEKVKENASKGQTAYLNWINSGHLNGCPGRVIEYAWVKQQVLEDAARFDIRELAFDRYNATHIMQEIQDEGLEVVEFGQGYISMSFPAKELANLVLKGLINHGNHPALKWMAGNVVIDKDPAGNIKPTKAKSKNKIDGIVALIMGLDRAIRQEDQLQVYQGSGKL